MNRTIALDLNPTNICIPFFFSLKINCGKDKKVKYISFLVKLTDHYLLI